MRDLIVYTGPMAAGKTKYVIDEYHRLIERKETVVAAKPSVEVRDSGIESRTNRRIDAIQLRRLGQSALLPEFSFATAIVVDEVFMFSEDVEDTQNTIASWIEKRKKVRLSTLNYSAMGKEMRVFSALKELEPEIVYCTDGVCDFNELCGNTLAERTLIYDLATARPIREGLGELVPENPKQPKYGYSPVCRDCFEGGKNESELINFLSSKRAA